MINNKLIPYGRKEKPILEGRWGVQTNWKFYISNLQPLGLPTTSSICILFNKNGLILTKTIKGGWEFPGGRCNIDSNGILEDRYFTLQREVNEETGCKINYATEIAVKTIFNKGEVINSENQLPFPKKAFQEYFLGWTDNLEFNYHGKEVLGARVIQIKNINSNILSEMHEPFEFLNICIYIYDELKGTVDNRIYHKISNSISHLLKLKNEFTK